MGWAWVVRVRAVARRGRQGFFMETGVGREPELKIEKLGEGEGFVREIGHVRGKTRNGEGVAVSPKPAFWSQRGRQPRFRITFTAKYRYWNYDIHRP